MDKLAFKIALIVALISFIINLVINISPFTGLIRSMIVYIGVLFVYIFQKKIVLKKLKYFLSIFSILFVLSPASYLYISFTETDKRTDYPGKKISQIVQEQWENNFTNKIGLVAGDVWHGGNLSYHLKSRPKWDNILEAKKTISLKDIEGGFVIIGDSETLQKICSGIFFRAETQGICMVGAKK